MDDNVINSLRNMIMSFRVAELQMLLGFAGKQKSGKKNELQVQALELLKGRTLTTSVQNKIKELHRQRYNNSLNYLSTAVGNSSDSCDSDMTSNYGHSSGQMTTRSTANSLHHGLHSLSSASNSHLMSASNASNMSLMAKQSGSRGDYYASMPRNLGIVTNDYPPKPYQSMSTSIPVSYPVFPDVVFKALPFYDNLGDLLKPSSLVPSVPGSRFQESMFSFHLTPDQANRVAMSREVHPGPKIEYTVQVQLRFCLNETTCEQEDNFPPSICVKVNSKMCPLPNPLPTNKPGVEPKRPSRPVNITTLCKLSPTVSNQISISWAADYNRPYAVGVFLVEKLTSHSLLQRVKQKGVRNSDHTRAMIKEKLSHDPDSEIATMSLRGSLLCPLGKMRIQIPCRAITCAHVQCFDALLYLQMNEKKPTWVCPVCDKPAIFANLWIDGLFNEIIKEAPSTCNEVQFHEDGSWTPVVTKKEDSYETLSPGSRRTKRPSSPEKSEPKRPKVDVITIDTSDEDEDDDDETIRDSAAEPSTPVLSSGSGSESDTNQMQSLPSPDSSSSASSTVQPIGSRSLNRPSPSNSAQPMGSGSNSRATNLSSMANMSRSTASTLSATNPYPSMPALNQYYNGFPDFLSTSNNPFNYSNIDMSSAFDQMFRQSSDNRDVSTPSYLSTSSTSSRRGPDIDPDIISID